MLKSELSQLEKHIGDILANEQAVNTTRRPGHLEEELRKVQTLCRSLQTKWVHELFSSVKEHVILRYVQYHQAGLTALSNKISLRLVAEDFKAGNKVLYLDGYQYLLSELEGLLSFFRHSFYKYFDLDYKVTIFQCLKQAQEFREFQKELGALAGTHPDSLSLVTVLLISVNELYQEVQTENISYRQADQALNLLRLAFHMLNVIPDIAPETLAKSFYRQNLNTLHFFNWYRGFLSARINLNSEESGKEDAVKKEIQSLEKVFVDPGKTFEPELPSIDFMVTGWLKEQAGDQELKSSETDKKFTNVQLGLTLSVAQFALFIRVFYQAGCFSTTNISKIMRFFTHYFTTKKQSNISLKSFGRAFYSSDQSAAAVVRDYLQKMINYIDKNFFP